jgi:hypothetical protein
MSYVQQPVMIGYYEDATGPQFAPVARPELDRAQEAYFQVISTFRFTPRSKVLVISRSREAAQVVPFERACVAANMVVCNADSSPFEAGRVEAFIRRFEIAAVAGLSAEVLDALVAAGHDPAKLFAGKVVWARSGAYERLAGLPSISLRRWTMVGPALCIECAHGEGPHLDSREWTPSVQAGRVVLKSRLPRALAVEVYDTGLQGEVDEGFCACGSADPRLAIPS